MGSLPIDMQKRIRFVITGFSKFCGIKENPTEKLVDILPEFIKSQGLDIREFYSFSVIKVSALKCDNFLSSTANRISEEFPDDIIAWIHLGVDSCAQSIALEKQAVNNATFSAPDEDQCIFMNSQIDESLAFNDPIETPYNLDTLISKLKRDGFDAHVSYHAGCFLCNWIYFRSLRQRKIYNKSNWYPLFVHVPLFSEIPQEIQLNFLISLFQHVKEQLVKTKHLCF